MKKAIAVTSTYLTPQINMYISVFQLFKIGIGPSSSHTVGPINASNKFISYLKKENISIKSLQINLYGSLSFTGKGHGTHLGIIGGLLGYSPETIRIKELKSEIVKINKLKKITLNNINTTIPFNSEENIAFTNKILPKHKYSNVMEFKAVSLKNNKVIKKIYYSIGGGFVIENRENKKAISNKPGLY